MHYYSEQIGAYQGEKYSPEDIDIPEKPGQEYDYDPVAGEWVISKERHNAPILAMLSEIDTESLRPLRAIAAGTQTQYDTDRLSELEAEATQLRAQLMK